MLEIDYDVKFFANIRQSWQKRNKMTKKMTKIVKNSSIRDFFDAGKRYF